MEKRIQSECYPCLFKQLLSLAELMELKETEKKVLIEDAMQYLQSFDITTGNRFENSRYRKYH